MYNVLVWAADAGKFAKDFCINQKCVDDINKIWVLGNELRIEDLKALNNVEAFGVSVVIDEDVFGIKRDTELFVLGKCAAERDANKSQSDLGLAVYTAADKSTVEASKKLGISLINWAGLNNVKQSAGKSKNTKKKIATTPIETQTTATHKETTKKDTKNEISQSSKVNNIKTNSTIVKILKSTKLSKEITSLLTKEALDNIEKAINNASDPEIGLPMLIKIYCGFTEEISKQIANAIAPEFKVLKAH